MLARVAAIFGIDGKKSTRPRPSFCNRQKEDYEISLLRPAQHRSEVEQMRDD
jgi:hypothetical protein